METAVIVGPEHEADRQREQLNRIVTSHTFHGSARHRRFLSYVVEKVLCGDALRLKGYTLGLEVFDRGDDFDPQLDPVVRIEAGRLRRSLDRYYLTEGKDDPIVISIPKGGYVPDFTESTKALPLALAPPTPSAPFAVAVLPFRNSGDEVEDAKSLAEDISANLTCFRHLDVIPSVVAQTAPLSPGKFTLTGSVHISNGGSRVTACLIENKTRISIWSRIFDLAGTAKPSTAALRKIAAAIAAEVGHPIGPLKRFVSRNEEYGNDTCVALHEAQLYARKLEMECGFSEYGQCFGRPL